ncbi:MAG: hypothetical protein AAF404_21640, partial [Pseudomonadota bacterium]
MKLQICAIAVSVMLLSACSGSNSVTVDATADESGSDAGADNDTGSGDTGDGSTDGNGTDGNSTDNGEDNTGNPSSQTMATYRVTFNASWSADSHPLEFPSNPHFSGLVGAVHNEQVQFWMSGQLATDGMKLMAETGGKTLLLEEVDAA